MHYVGPCVKRYVRPIRFKIQLKFESSMPDVRFERKQPIHRYVGDNSHQEPKYTNSTQIWIL